jgi:hypothetical protein
MTHYHYNYYAMQIRELLHKRQQRWEATLSARKAAARTVTTVPVTLPMEARQAQFEARRAEKAAARAAADAAAEAAATAAEHKRQQQLLKAAAVPFKETKHSIAKAEQVRG